MSQSSASDGSPHDGAPRYPEWTTQLLFLFFFLSGACGLIYEITWMRLLGLICGVSHLAITFVLVVFMSGLGLGYEIGRRWTGPQYAVFKRYAILEIFIGIYGFGSPFLLQWIDKVIQASSSGSNEPAGAIGGLLVILGASFITLLLPTIAMGMTLPLVSHGLARLSGTIGSSVAMLYGMNTLGAVIGVSIGGLVLLPQLGIHLTIYFAATLNCLVGIAALITLRDQVPAPVVKHDVSERQPDDAPKIETAQNWQRRLLLPAYGLSGVASLSCELAWTRGMIVSFGSSVYAFTIVLATFLSGIGIGSIVYRKISRNRIPDLSWFGILELLLGVSILLSIILIGILPYLFLLLFHLTGGNIPLLFAGELFLAALAIAIPTLIMGILFPLVSQLHCANRDETGKTVGRLGAINTLGSVIGVLLTGLVFIPWLGSDQSLRGAAILTMVIGAHFLVTPSFLKVDRTKSIRLAVLIGILVLLAVVTPGWNPATLSQGIFQYAPQIVDNKLPKLDVLYYRDGWTAQVAVTQQGDRHSLRINGKVDGSDGPDQQTQVLLAELPLLFSQDPRDVFVLGLGTGVTVGTVLTYPVKSVTCSEIEKRVIEAAEFFTHINGAALSDDRANIVISDARSYLRNSHRTWDVIINEPSNPWIRGIANLFSVEFFTLCRERLSQNGIICQWLHVYGMDRDDVDCALQSFFSVFPNAILWRGSEGDLLMLGFKGDFAIDAATMMDRFEKHSELFTAIGIRSLKELMSGFVASSGSLTSRLENAVLNVDDLPRLEFTTPLHIYLQQSNLHILQLLLDGALDQPPFLGDGAADLLEEIRFQRSMECLNAGETEKANILLEKSLIEQPNKPANAFNLAMLLIQLSKVDQAKAILTSFSGDQNDPIILWGRATIAAQQGDMPLAEELCQQILILAPDFTQARDLLSALSQHPRP